MREAELLNYDAQLIARTALGGRRTEQCRARDSARNPYSNQESGLHSVVPAAAAEIDSLEGNHGSSVKRAAMLWRACNGCQRHRADSTCDSLMQTGCTAVA
jgi:hypothetical protein